MLNKKIRSHDFTTHLRIQKIINFLFGNLNSTIHHAALQFLQCHLLANLLSRLQVDTGLIQYLQIIIESHAVVVGHTAKNSVNLIIVKTDTYSLCQLHLQIFNYQRIQYFSPELLGFWKSAVGASRIPSNFSNTCIKLALQDHTLVDEGDDSVQ